MAAGIKEKMGEGGIDKNWNWRKTRIQMCMTAKDMEGGAGEGKIAPSLSEQYFFFICTVGRT